MRQRKVTACLLALGLLTVAALALAEIPAGPKLLALLLTYAAITCNSVPSVLKALTEGAAPVASDYVIAVMFSLWAPFIDPVRNIMGIIIIAIGLWEAWKVNRRVTIDLAGPYPLTKSASQGASTLAPF